LIYMFTCMYCICETKSIKKSLGGESGGVKRVGLLRENEQVHTQRNECVWNVAIDGNSAESSLCIYGFVKWQKKSSQTS
jgi:hypothetical protein